MDGLDWFQLYELFVHAAKRTKDKDDEKIALLLNQLGPQGVQIFNTFRTTDDKPLTSYEEVVKDFKTYFEPKKNVLYERYKFNTYEMRPNQPILEYLVQLKTTAVSCEFDSAERDNIIRDRLLSQIRDKSLINKILERGDLTLDSMLEVVKAHLQRQEQLIDMGNSSQGFQVDLVKRYPDNKGNIKPNTNEFNCLKCGRKHGPRECPAYNRKCNYCSGLHHFEVGCKKKKSESVKYVNKSHNGGTKMTRSVQVQDLSSSSDESSYVDNLSIFSNVVQCNDEWNFKAKINNRSIIFNILGHKLIYYLNRASKMYTVEIVLNLLKLKLS